MIQELLVFEAAGVVDVFRISQLPARTPIGDDARRLRLVGPRPVDPPQTRFTVPEWERWRKELEQAGYEVVVERFWRKPLAQSIAESYDRREDYIPLREAFDELLRRAEERGQQDDRRIGPVEPGDARRP